MLKSSLVRCYIMITIYITWNAEWYFGYSNTFNVSQV